MLVELHNSFKNPIRVQATRVVVYDDFGNPVGVFVQTQPGELIAEIADNDTRFPKLLKMLGLPITKVDVVSPALLKPMTF